MNTTSKADTTAAAMTEMAAVTSRFQPGALRAVKDGARADRPWSIIVSMGGHEFTAFYAVTAHGARAVLNAFVAGKEGHALHSEMAVADRMAAQ